MVPQAQNLNDSTTYVDYYNNLINKTLYNLASPNITISEKISKNVGTAEDDLIIKINKNFDKLKDIFPDGNPNSRHTVNTIRKKKKIKSSKIPSGPCFYFQSIMPSVTQCLWLAAASNQMSPFICKHLLQQPMSQYYWLRVICR